MLGSCIDDKQFREHEIGYELEHDPPGTVRAAIDMLENAIMACPDGLWSDPSTPGVAGFWYVAYHTLFYLDLQLSGTVEGFAQGFAPPAPFDLRELDPTGLLPERPYTKDELRTYLQHCRKKCREAIVALTEDGAHRSCRWGSLDLTSPSCCCITCTTFSITQPN